MSVRKQSLIATIAISGSRVAGLIREIVFAFFFGASPVLDAYLTAFRIPNLLRDLFSEGALSQAFVTVFAKKRVTEKDQSAFELAYLVQGFILVVVGCLIILGIYFSPAIVSSIASGFTGDKLHYAIYLNRILFPFILFVSLAAVSMGMLNSFGKFALPQSASTFFNIGSITIGLIMAFWMAPEYAQQIKDHFIYGKPLNEPNWHTATRAMTGMAFGTLAGGFIQWVIQIPALMKLGFKPLFKFDFKNKDLKQVLKLTVPAIIGGAAVQINVLINTNFASYLADGSISWLNYAFRLMQFPIGVFGVAIASATAPELARKIVSKDHEAVRSTIQNSLSMALFLCIPSALGLIILAKPIIALIYQHGHFTISDTEQAALALQAYAIGLSFYSLIKIYQPAFLANNNAKTPMFISLGSVALNAFVNYLFVFVFHFSHWGLALGTSCVACFNFILLGLFLRKYISGIWQKSLVINLLKIIFTSSFAMILAMMTLNELQDLSYLFSKLAFQLLLVFVPISIAIGVFITMGMLFKIPEAHQLRILILKKFNR